jgi:hypothetical protein
LTNPTRQPVRIPQTINLRDWKDWQTVTLDNTTLELTDDPVSSRQRFYRVIGEEPAS